jgi:tetratricopeptide (TPR) repeat protein
MIATALATPSIGFAADEDLQREQIFAALKSAATEAEGRAAESIVWQYWLAQGPTPQVRITVADGMKRREAYDFQGAEELFDLAVEQAPDYAEGWNQRAFARFLRDNIDGALGDLERTVELEPLHFGAWSGLYHVLIRTGRPEAAHSALVRAVEIHPWIRERGLLPPDPGAKRPAIKGREQDL